MPLLAGTASLAAVAGLFFIFPIPEARKPQPALETFPTETIPTEPTSEPLPTEESDILEPENSNLETSGELESTQEE